MREHAPAAAAVHGPRHVRLQPDRTTEKPVIASVQTTPSPGTELILCCDLVVVADDAVFGLREIVVGIREGGPVGCCVGWAQQRPRSWP
jgi:enoyl-CoA hydratase/carnithine racemase